MKVRPRRSTAGDGTASVELAKADKKVADAMAKRDRVRSRKRSGHRGRSRRRTRSRTDSSGRSVTMRLQPRVQRRFAEPEDGKLCRHAPGGCDLVAMRSPSIGERRWRSGVVERSCQPSPSPFMTDTAPPRASTVDIVDPESKRSPRSRLTFEGEERISATFRRNGRRPCSPISGTMAATTLCRRSLSCTRADLKPDDLIEAATAQLRPAKAGVLGLSDRHPGCGRLGRRTGRLRRTRQDICRRADRGDAAILGTQYLIRRFNHPARKIASIRFPRASSSTSLSR